jgi:deazaflavin-dependent oxidoreductase (nitroreductase family)
MVLPRGLARFNKRVTNRVQGLWAPYLPPWAVIVHKGRKSGRSFRTPVLAYKSGTQLGIVLYYGERADWLRNVLAAGEASVVRAGKTVGLTNPRVLDATDPAVGAGLRRLAGRRRVFLGELGD